MKIQIIELIYSSIDEINKNRDAEKLIEKSEDTVIFGANSKLDSLGLVNLIVSLEEKVNDAFAKNITLADERAMSLEKSPFRTVRTLSDFILELLEYD